MLITLLTIVLGIFLSFIATVFSMNGYSNAGIKCATGAMAFLFLGSAISLTIVPLLGIIYFFVFQSRHENKIPANE